MIGSKLWRKNNPSWTWRQTTLMLQPHHLLIICHLVQQDSGALSLLPTANICLLTSRQHHPMGETHSAVPTESLSTWEHTLLILTNDCQVWRHQPCSFLALIDTALGCDLHCPQRFPARLSHTYCPLWLWLISHSARTSSLPRLHSLYPPWAFSGNTF